MTSGLGSTARLFALAARNGELRRLELAFAAFNGAEWAVWLALLVYAYQRGGATAAGLIALVQLLPSALLAPVLSTLADRLRAGRVLLAGYLLQAVTMGLLATAIALGAPRLTVFALAPLTTLAITVTRPAQAAVLPSVVRSPEQLTCANVVAGWMESASVLVAPAVAGVLMSVGGPELAIAAMAVLILVAALLVTPIEGPPPMPAVDDGGKSRFTAEVVDGMRVVARHRAARVLVLVLGAQYVLIGALDLLYVVLAIDLLHTGASGAGYLNAAFGAGGLIGGIVTAVLVSRRRLAPALVAGIALVAAALVILAAAPGEAAAFALLALAGLGRMVFDVTGRTLLQRTVPAEILARVFGLLESLMDAGLALGSILVPVLVAIGGPRLALAGSGILLAVVVAAGLRRLWTIDQAADLPLVELSLLRRLPLFSPLPGPPLATLARSLAPVSVRANDVVIRQGDPGDLFYAIADGELEVVRDGVPVARLGRGEGVGEIALLHSVPRSATVVAASDAQLYALGKLPFLLALTGHPAAGRAAQGVAEARLHELEQLSGRPAV
jgi:MFS family permease